MKVPVLNQYSNRYLENETESYGNAAAVRKINTNGNGSAATGVGNTESIITRREREFFIRMFPENSEQLERHVLFNRNGKIQNTTFSKGTLVDGRV